MDFPIGYYGFHQNEAINFQMNRWYSLGCIDYETLMAAGKEISDFDCWAKTFLKLAGQYRSKGDHVACATCLRAAQFYTLGDERDAKGQLLKVSIYEQCMEEYQIAYQNAGLSYVRIQFENGYIPALYKCHEKGGKGKVVLHGGYDSFIQEFIPYMQHIYESGFDVCMFEGYGQGEVLNRCGIKMRPEWENCTSPVLDYFNLDDVTLIGVSLGGYLAARAAAYEMRIKRVVLFDLIYDFYGALLRRMPLPLRWGIRLLMHFPRSPLWKIIEKIIDGNPFGNWLFRQGCYVYGNITTFYEYLTATKMYNTRTISALIKQDVLVLAGEDDLYTVYYQEQMEALCCARSVSGRIFTKEENASHHCQIGNIKLAWDYIFGWVDTVTNASSG